MFALTENQTDRQTVEESDRGADGHV